MLVHIWVTDEDTGPPRAAPQAAGATPIPAAATPAPATVAAVGLVAPPPQATATAATPTLALAEAISAPLEQWFNDWTEPEAGTSGRRSCCRW
jgi:hypothetical protein